MKKNLITILLIIMSLPLYAQTYRVLSRHNDTIKLYSNTIGASLKSMVPNGTNTNTYRLIEKNDKGKSSQIFVEFIQVLDKYLVTYETDLVTVGKWTMKIYGFTDIYNACKRVNAIYLRGTFLGMNIEIYQRPDNFKDVIVIDGEQSMLPIKIDIYEANAAQALAEANLKAEQEANAKAEQLAKDKANLERHIADGEKMGLTREVVEASLGKHDEYYIAYLFKAKIFENSLRTEVFNKFDRTEIENYYNTYTKEQLLFLGEGHSKSLLKYKVSTYY